MLCARQISVSNYSATSSLCTKRKSIETHEARAFLEQRQNIFAKSKQNKVALTTICE